MTDATGNDSGIGCWRIDAAAAGIGQRANFRSPTGRIVNQSPVFATPVGVHGWLRNRGCIQSIDNTGVWLEP